MREVSLAVRSFICDLRTTLIKHERSRGIGSGPGLQGKLIEKMWIDQINVSTEVATKVNDIRSLLPIKIAVNIIPPNCIHGFCTHYPVHIDNTTRATREIGIVSGIERGH